MLTLPSEPLPQTVLMEPLPSIPPSFMNYGLTGSRRSPRKHHVTERRAPPKPYDKPTARPRPAAPVAPAAPAAPTAPVTHSVSSRLERTPLKDPLPQERLDFSVSSENVCDKLTRPNISSHKPSPQTDRSHVCPKATPLETRSLLAPEPASKGWVIGPIFQSFKSKMASFTDIVMSPFKSSSETEPPPNQPSSAENTAEGYVTAEEDAEAPDQHTDLSPQCVRKSEEGLTRDKLNNTDTKHKYDDVPLQKTEREADVTQSAWNTTTTTTTTTAFTTTTCKVLDVAGEECVSRSARTRKRTNKVSDDRELHKDVQDCNVLRNTDLDQVKDFIKNEVEESQADQTPTSPSILEEASLKKVKRTLDLNCDTSKRKKTVVQTESERADPAQKRKPKCNEGLPNAVTKAVTRAKNKKSKVEPEEGVALTVENERNAVRLVDPAATDDMKAPKVKAKSIRKTKVKEDQSLVLQTSLAVETKPTEKTAAIATKKRKAKDDSNQRSEVNTCSLSSKEEKRGKIGRRLKKIKTVAMEGAVPEVEAEEVYFEMTPFEKEESDDVEEGVPKRRMRRMEPQRRRCRGSRRNNSPSKRAAVDSLDGLTREDSDAFRKGVSTRLLRSVSCPEIPTLRLHETPWTPHFHSPPRSRSQPPQQQHPAPHSLSSSSLAHHFHRSARRTRRHTVCSLEVEREIAPLCLRKEVYPARRSSSPYDPQHLSPMRVLSPGASLSALASCFLSSPLAFLSKKSEGSRSSVSSPSRALSPTVRLLSPTPAALRALSPASPSLTSLLGTSLGQLPGFHLRTDTLLNASSDSTNNVVGGALLAGAPDPPPAPEEDEDTSSSSPESEELREETTHSDSELKVLKKDQGQRKVSSIKIRKALPKPQNNLTPMGLPKAVRVKKKQFSLEEIYTNKNFNKPPESRLETIFEVPLSRKNGSESWCGPRRVKRFMEFPELGEARRPRKPPVGAAKPNASNSRPRRGGCREDPVLVSDPDSVLCAKLEQLGLWLQQNES